MAPYMVEWQARKSGWEFSGLGKNMTHKFKWLVKADLMEKLKSEQTLEGGMNINHKLFRGRMFQTGEHVQSP